MNVVLFLPDAVSWVGANLDGVKKLTLWEG